MRKGETMKTITADTQLVAACGLYCGACGQYLQEKCPGCKGNDKASWCKVRSCTQKKGIQSCADCKDFPKAAECKDFNNFMSKVFGLIFRSDRQACVTMIQAKGYKEFAKYMAENKLQSIKRK
jgi:hypothetical protein